jgi:hypothetical protein
MQTPDFAPDTESKPISTRLGGLVKDLPNRQGTIPPFKSWDRPGMKTGLRNHPIGKKVSLIAFRFLEFNSAGAKVEDTGEVVAIRSKR